MPKASVKVMRSYDYCHFEVALSSDDEMDLDQVNELRIQAALLVDEAVRQYKIAKTKEGKRATREYETEHALTRMKLLKEKPQNDLTVQEIAELRSYEDKKFWDGLHGDDYYYGQDPERDHHFSMLRRFQDSKVLA